MPHHELKVCEIGIYRCPLDQHTKELDEARKRYLAPHESTRTTAPAAYENAETCFDKEYWYPWWYNEAVGWLRIYRLGSQIRGELWFVKGKRVSAKMKKRFQYLGKAFELSFYPEQSSREITEKIIRELRRISKELPIKNRHLDTECFENVAPYINWRGILGFELCHA